MKMKEFGPPGGGARVPGAPPWIRQWFCFSLQACMDCDEDALYDIIQDGVTVEQVNERDRSGRVSFFFIHY